MQAIFTKENKAWWMTELPDLTESFYRYIRRKTFLDLGSGNGKVVQEALKCGAKTAKGLEVSETMLNQTVAKEHIINKDMFTVDWSEYEVLYYFMGCPFDNQVIEKMNKEAKGLVIIYCRKVEKESENFIKQLNGKLMSRSQYLWVLDFRKK